jgi:DNA-binding transcriptional ArsR family regulator
MTQNICIRVLADHDQIKRCKTNIANKDQQISKLSDVLSLAGNEVRLKILFLLDEENELCVCDLSDILGMNISAISQHLRKLKDGNIVGIRKEGQTYFYFIKEDSLYILDAFFTIIRSKNKFHKTKVL